MRLLKIITSGILALALAATSISTPVKVQAEQAEGSGYIFIDEYPTEGDYQDGQRIKAIKANELYNKTAFVDMSKSTSDKYTGQVYTHNSMFDKCSIVHGIDVSKWNGTINWSKVKADGIEFAFIRVGNRGVFDGTLYEDPTYKYNIEQAIAAGIKVGVYIYSQAITEKEAIEEADYALSRIKKYNITMPVVFDFEYYNGPSGRLYDAHLSVKQATDVCEAFCKRVEEAGYTGMLYGNPSMFKSSVNAARIAKNYPIWLAHYTTQSSYEGQYDYWQYSSSGKINGISGAVDCIFWYNPVAATGLTLSTTKKTMTVGQTYKIKGTVKPKKSTDLVSWKSSNPNVAYVDQAGNIVASYRGTTTITGTTTSGVSATCEITVNDKLSNYEIAPLNKTEYTYAGYALEPTVTVRSKEKLPVSGTTNTSVNLRTGPGVDYSSKVTLPANTSVTIYNTHKSTLDENWYSVKCKYNNKTYRGYVFAEYVTDKKEYVVLDEKNYKIEYSSNVNAGTAQIVVSAVTANNFKGTLKKSFVINRKSIKNFANYNIDSYNYTGSPIEPDVIMLYKNKVLKKDKDYKLSYKNNVGSGTATVTIEGIGNYMHTVNKTFRIVGSRKYTVEAIGDQTYTGSEIKPAVVVKDIETGKVLGTGEYEVKYSNNINIGASTATIKGIGKYDGVVNVKFNIVEAATTKKPITVYNVENSEYTGKEVTPAIKVVSEGKVLTSDNYDVVYENNIAVGEAKVTVTGKGDYTGVVEIIYYVERANINNKEFSVNEIEARTYSGEANTPQIILQDKEKGLVDGTDYIVDYLDNVDAGTGIARITGIGSYTGVRDVKFTILPKSIEVATAEEIANIAYEVEAVKPEPKVTYEGLVLNKDKDYTLSYKNNKNVGVATVYITGCGNYEGTITKQFNIVKRNIRTASFNEIANATYNGNKKTPSVVVKYNNKKLIKDKAYTVSYSSNKAIGTAKITITGIGNFTGKKVLYFKIVPAKVKNYKLTKKKTNVELKWDSVKGATGYQVYRSARKDGKYVKIVQTKQNKYTNKNLTLGKNYYYKVRAYKETDGKIILGDFSTVKGGQIVINGKSKADNLNVRKGASTSSIVKVKINKNQKVTIIGQVKDSSKNTWYKVKLTKASKNYVGYVYAKYISY